MPRWPGKALAALLCLVAATGCASRPRGSEAVFACTNAKLIRVEDRLCPNWTDATGFSGGSYYPYFWPAGSYVPPVGQLVSGGYRTPPTRTTTVYRAPARGGNTRMGTVPTGPQPPAVKPPPKPAVPPKRAAVPPRANQPARPAAPRRR